jgi:hypothetical protein
LPTPRCSPWKAPASSPKRSPRISPSSSLDSSARRHTGRPHARRNVSASTSNSGRGSRCSMSSAWYGSSNTCTSAVMKERMSSWFIRSIAH